MRFRRVSYGTVLDDGNAAVSNHRAAACGAVSIARNPVF